jgi:23S rRNA (guanosine2251-2'-O)-methyltransferase
MYMKSNDLFKETHPEMIYEKIQKPIIIADHLLTPDNMGSMIRLADNIGASEMCFLGIAPTHSLSKVKKAAASSKDNIKWYYTEDDDIRKIVGDKKIVAIETSDNAE